MHFQPIFSTPDGGLQAGAAAVVQPLRRHQKGPPTALLARQNPARQATKLSSQSKALNRSFAGLIQNP
jgi:hypothetical protein